MPVRSASPLAGGLQISCRGTPGGTPETPALNRPSGLGKAQRGSSVIRSLHMMREGRASERGQGSLLQDGGEAQDLAERGPAAPLRATGAAQNKFALAFAGE